MIIEDSSNVPYTYKGIARHLSASTPPARPSSIRRCSCPISRRHTKHLGLVPTLSVTRIPAVPAGAAGQLARPCHRRPHRLELRHRQQRRRGAELRPRQAAAARRALRRRRRIRRRGDAAVGGVGGGRGGARSRHQPMFADGSKVHPINHEGKYFKVPRAAQRAALAAGPRADRARPAARRAARSSPRAGPTRSSPRAAAASRR